VTTDSLKGREVLLEFSTMGNYVKVSAIDVQSMVEISISGPANAGEAVLKKNALQRLTYILRKKAIIS
jgi:hypothetical protein